MNKKSISIILAGVLSILNSEAEGGTPPSAMPMLVDQNPENQKYTVSTASDRNITVSANKDNIPLDEAFSDLKNSNLDQTHHIQTVTYTNQNGNTDNEKFFSDSEVNDFVKKCLTCPFQNATFVEKK